MPDVWKISVVRIVARCPVEMMDVEAVAANVLTDTTVLLVTVSMKHVYLIVRIDSVVWTRTVTSLAELAPRDRLVSMADASVLVHPAMNDHVGCVAP